MKSSDKYILAIDLGTSGPKVLLVTAGGEVVACERDETPLYLMPGGGAEQDPQEWWQAICRATRRLLGQLSFPAESIAAIGCTTQWAGTVAVDREGRSLMRALIWLDSRGAPYVRRITGGLLEFGGYNPARLWAWLRLTGGAPGRSGKEPFGHILYIKNERPEIYEQTYKFLEPLDYLNMRLTGRFLSTCHTIALHWLTDNRRIDRVCYASKLLDMTGIDVQKLPDLKQGTEIIGPLTTKAAADLGLPETVQVVMGAPDIHASAIGAGAVRDYQSNLYIGTSSWLTCHVPFKKTDVLHSIGTLPSALPGRYLVINEQETAGACLNYLRDNILFPGEELDRAGGEQAVYGLFEQMAHETPAGSDRVIFTPWLNGERTPVDDHLTRSGFYNLSLQHNRAHMVRAVLEGVAYNSRWLLEHVERFVKRPLEQIHMVGGGANSNIWCQIHADVLQRTVKQIRDPIQATGRGAALLAAVAMDYLSFDDVAQQAHIAATYKPNPKNCLLYDELYREFLELYRCNKGIYHRLNQPA